MAYTTIDKPSDYFNTKLYTGTNATQSITGVGFQPDLSWFKTRSDANGHTWIDSVRGLTKRLASHNNQGDITQADMLTSFDTDGLTLGADSNNYTNWSGKTWVVWNWLASNTTASNTDGSTTSTVSANTTAGFSIVSYTGAGATTYGHGLGATPNVIIIKKRTSDTGNNNWFLYHDKVITAGASNKSFMTLNETGALASNGTATTFTSVSDTTFGVGTDDIISESSHTFIAYCFAEKKAYSKFGSYVGNGSTDGAFVYTGFKPAFVIIKRTSSAQNWGMYDNKREPFNTNDAVLFPNLSNAETSSVNYALDFVSNGFKQRATGNQSNGSGQTYIYMAFAENPFVTSTGIPTTAR